MATMARPKAKAMPTCPMASPPSTAAPQPISTSTAVPMNSAISLFMTLGIPRKTSHAGSESGPDRSTLPATSRRMQADRLLSAQEISGGGAGRSDGGPHRVDVSQGNFVFPLDGGAAHADMRIAEGHAALDGVERGEMHLVDARRLPHPSDIAGIERAAGHDDDATSGQFLRVLKNIDA